MTLSLTVDGYSVTNDFLVPGCICAQKWTNTVWFVKILERRQADQTYTFAKDQEFFSGKYLKQARETRYKIYFQEMKKNMFFYKTSVNYLFVNFEKNKNLYSISQIDYCDAISYVEHFSMSL